MGKRARRLKRILEEQKRKEGMTTEIEPETEDLPRNSSRPYTLRLSEGEFTLTTNLARLTTPAGSPGPAVEIVVRGELLNRLSIPQIFALVADSTLKVRENLMRLAEPGIKTLENLEGILKSDSSSERIIGQQSAMLKDTLTGVNDEG